MKLLKLLKRLAFGLLGAVMAVLVTATVLEKIYGTDFAAAHIYGAGWFAALWGALTLAALACLFRRKLWRRPAVLLLHLSFAVILAGASVTWLFGRQGTLHLRTGDPGATAFAGRDGSEQILPFRARLDDFRIEYYAGTRAPMDFVSLLTLTADDGSLHGEVGMNRILVFRNYRFYQSAYDEDGRGTTLSVSYDPWGIGITYAGYGLLLVSMLAFLCDRRGGFRRLLRSPALRKAALCLVLCTAAVQGARAADTLPQTLPREVAAELGDLYVYYNDRICPLQTLAKDFTVKLCGKSRYRGLTPEQVLSGWLFYYDDWKREPMIRIRSAGARRLLEVGGRYARLSDFRNRVNEYRLEGAAGRPAGEADEKFNIIGMVCTGSMLRIFPYTDPSDSLLRWASQVDGLPRELPHGQALFIGRAMNYVSELVVKRDWAGVAGVLRKIRSYQQKEGGAHMPSGLRFRAEKLYNRLDWSLPLAAAFILTGIGGFLDACRRMVRGRAFGAKTRGWLLAGVAAGGLYLTLMLALRGYVSGHWPVSNGYETMRFMAWCTLLLTLLFARRFLFLLPFGYLIAGLSLMVSMMGESNPQITQLMPVLDSPLLCIHVMLVMVAYALLAFVMFGGVAGVVLHRRARGVAAQLQAVSRLMLYPAVFCLAAGIFVGPSGPMCRGDATGAGIPRRYGRSSRCWFMRCPCMPVPCRGSAGRCFSIGSASRRSSLCWSPISGSISCWAACTAMPDRGAAARGGMPLSCVPVVPIVWRGRHCAAER